MIRRKNVPLGYWSPLHSFSIYEPPVRVRPLTDRGRIAFAKGSDLSSPPWDFQFPRI